eukprot:2654577-Heterocapsa_arctica.AAC.1
MAFAGTWLKPANRRRAMDTSSSAGGDRCVRGNSPSAAEGERPRPMASSRSRAAALSAASRACAQSS